MAVALGLAVACGGSSEPSSPSDRRDAAVTADGASVSRGDGAAHPERDAAVPRPASDAGAAPNTSGRDAGALACSAAAPAEFTLPRIAAAADPLSDEDAGVLPAPELVAGPIVGAVSDHEAKVWFRSSAATSSALSYWPEQHPDRVRTLTGPQLDATTDFIGVVRVPELDPGARYGYSLSLAGADAAHPSSEAQHRFTTLPAAGIPARVRIAVGADIAGRYNQPIFEQIAESQPDVLLLIGDQVYADESDASIEGYAERYRFSWNIRQLRALLSSVPSAMMWDDHEIVDNYFTGKTPRYQPARTAYELYVHGHNPDPLRRAALYYTFEAAQVGFFVLDVRSDRSAQSLADGPGKTMLGAQQKADLLTWLSCSRARIKVIVSPVIFSTWTATGLDSWAGYRHERDEILDFIAANRIDDVLLITGDQHWSAIFLTTHRDYRFYEFLPTPLSKDHGTAPLEETPEIVARDDDHFVFGVVDIDTRPTPATIALTLCAGGQPCKPGEEPDPSSGLDLESYAENVPFTLRLTTADLGLE